jgi:hypothetical protein
MQALANEQVLAASTEPIDTEHTQASSDDEQLCSVANKGN